MLTLLTYNRALLTCAGKLKERLLFLQDTLGVDGEELPSSSYTVLVIADHTACCMPVVGDMLNVICFCLPLSYVVAALSLLQTTKATDDRSACALLLPPPACPTPPHLAAWLRPAAEEQLFKLVHKYPSILRFPPEVCNAKLATVAALSATHPAWQAQWEARTPLRTLRIMQASWATLWRAAYLRSTGQAATCSLVQAVVTKHATFSQAYPDFLPWLNRCGAAWPGATGREQAQAGQQLRPLP
jgi:hypothetical protein